MLATAAVRDRGESERAGDALTGVQQRECRGGSDAGVPSASFGRASVILVGTQIGAAIDNEDSSSSAARSRPHAPAPGHPPRARPRHLARRQRHPQRLRWEDWRELGTFIGVEPKADVLPFPRSECDTNPNVSCLIS